MVITVYSPVFALLCMLLFVAFVGLPVFGAADVPPTRNGGRIPTLDGLRGILALSVFFHHAVINYQYQQNGVWSVPPSPFYVLLGQAGVALFFMITGYLFWQKMLLEEGRPRWVQLFIGRAFRIGPLYLLFVALMVLLIFAKSRWQFNGTVFGFVKSLARWVPFGALGQGPDLNHLPAISIASATWSLQYEWAFYAALVPLALFARNDVVSLVACLGGALVALALVAVVARPALVAPPIVCAATFLAGMSTAALQKRGVLRPLPRGAACTIALGLAVAALTFFPSAHGAGAIIVLAVLFALIASGCSVFGSLLTRSALRLGDMSYSLYLLHGVVLGAVFSIEPVKRFALDSPLRYWLVVALCGLVLIVLSTVSLVAVERPGVALGRALGRKVAAVRASRVERLVAGREEAGYAKQPSA